ncbi:Rho GTPase activation protein [Cunninghamella echinulata]|nr:Rho GTPase activation protein [Cunninghamella echinulata]
MPFSPSRSVSTSRRSLSTSIRLPQVNVDLLSRTSPEYKAIAELNIIYEAGLDNDSRPILILCANNLPNPDIFDYDLILADEFVESDYVLIFFSSPARHRPSWLWLIKAYRALDRRYKKNLKALYVVHLSRSYQIIFDLANKITSPKFARKLRYLSNLDELKQFIHVAENMIPQPVINFDNALPIVPSTFKVNSVTPAPQVSISFGRSLQDLANLEGWSLKSEYPVPKVVYQVIEHIRANGKKKENSLDKEGLFRKSPSSEELKQVKNKFNYGEQVNLNEHDIDVSAALLKVFLRELPTSVITPQQSNELTKLISNKEKDDIIRQRLQDGFAQKPYAFKLMQYLCKFLSEVEQHSGSNRMTAHNLAVVFAPNLIHANDPNENNNNPTTQQEAMINAKLYLEQMNQAISVVEYLILHQQSLFT